MIGGWPGFLFGVKTVLNLTWFYGLSPRGHAGVQYPKSYVNGIKRVEI